MASSPSPESDFEDSDSPSVPQKRDFIRIWKRDIENENCEEEEARRQELNTQLYDALQASNVEAVRKLLLDVKAFVADHSRARMRHREYFLDSDVVMDCFKVAIRSRDDDLACHAIRLGVVMPRVDSSEWTKFSNALVKSGMTKASKLLMRFVEQGEKNRSLLKSAVERKPQKAEFYINHGALVDWQDKSDHTALFIAAGNGDVALAKVLLRAGASLDITGRDGGTVYEAALKRSDKDMARLFLLPLLMDRKASKLVIVDLDFRLRELDIHGALKFLQRGYSVSLREVTSVCKPNVEQLVGNRNEYLNFLCSKVLDIEKSLESEGIKIPKDTGSLEHFLHASKWLLNCLTTHVGCIRAEGPLPLLPSRVIDVGPANGSQEPILLAAQGRRGRYVALSHRWGLSDIKKTTKSNFDDRLSGMMLADLTKTMQDAVKITRHLGVRYLWIDAICIIQDSYSDWSHEASRMSDVYRNSLFTIAAEAAADHSDGCFASSNSKSLGGELHSRGWILQEELLSPRTLHYGFGLLSWDCITSSWSFGDGKAAKATDYVMSIEQARFKRALWGFRSTSMPLEQQAYASWHHMVASYSRRTLTKDSDKLMAIRGIAAFVEDKIEDTFIAGLWKNNLYHDLLWVAGDSAPGRITSIKLPSWSWTSIRGCVSYSIWPASSNPRYMKSKLKLLSAEADDEGSGLICKKLVFRGALQKVRRGMKGVDHRLFAVTNGKIVNRFAEKEMFESQRGESSPITDSKQMQSNSAYWWQDIDTEDVDEAWVFPVTQEHYWIHGLVLVPANDADPGTDDVMERRREDKGSRERFRRVGRCYVDNDSNEAFFLEKDEITFELV